MTYIKLEEGDNTIIFEKDQWKEWIQCMIESESKFSISFIEMSDESFDQLPKFEDF